MAKEKKSLADYRQELLVKSALQREQLASQLEQLRKPGAVWSSGKGMLLRAAGKKPLLAGAAAFAVFLFLRKKVAGLFQRRSLFSLLAAGAVAFRTWMRFSPYLLPVLSRIGLFSRKS